MGSETAESGASKPAISCLPCKLHALFFQHGARQNGEQKQALSTVLLLEVSILYGLSGHQGAHSSPPSASAPSPVSLHVVQRKILTVPHGYIMRIARCTGQDASWSLHWRKVALAGRTGKWRWMGQMPMSLPGEHKKATFTGTYNKAWKFHE